MLSAQERYEELTREIEELKLREFRYKQENAIEFFDPLWYQSVALDYIHSGKMVVTLQGANGIGKTLFGASVVGSAGLGIQPWDHQDTRWGSNPVKIRIICSDWEKHAKGVMVPKLKEVFPRDQYTTSKNNVGVEASFRFPSTGSELEIITDKQDAQDHEGWEGDVVWADEHFGRDKFVANFRGLRKGKGLFLITLTAVSESWILDDIVLNPLDTYASITNIPQDANPYLTDEFKDTFRATLHEYELIPRVLGGWLNLVGLVWPGFRKDPINGRVGHLIDDFDVPTDWPVVPVIDWHPSTPQAISFYATDKHGRWYVVDEVWKHMGAEETADLIIRKMKTNVWRIEQVFIDPLAKGDTSYIKNLGIDIPDSFTTLRDRLWKEARIELHTASKDKDSGILNIEQMLNGVNGLPTLFFLRSLAQQKDWGHIWEIQRWTYKDGKPRDENDHFMENLYRMSLTGVKWTPPRNMREPLKSKTDFNVFD